MCWASESGQPERYYQYEVEPATGLVRKVKEERSLDYKHAAIPHTFYEPTGAIVGCRNDPQASSLDGEYLAYCRGGEADQYFVDDKKTAQSLYRGALGIGAEFGDLAGLAAVIRHLKSCSGRCVAGRS